ncbi:hypothetical protein F5Y00DRAFT_270980 [Daldinia vernicosa]|uniref:uncharacterized protein n=1 Tax=Daldinia vernicosa TaxID=114800 RepID=UPI0020084727|nr:uncharacterized protein F5Y00DRAFT_270980 [Daldinia vernicosa]KAI0847618.1 hypothetical protein F5Y00DRAFT_270980 [Daldinia vernicosa]
MSAPKSTAGSVGRPLTPSAPIFVPIDIYASHEVLDASFVTRTIPDISPDSRVIGLCAVSHERAGTDDLGWHIADFLAFKALLCGETHPKAQTWLSQCDIASVVKDNPEHYVHGKDHRLVNVAATSSSYTNRHGTIQKRDDEIKVESSAEKLIQDFLGAISDKSRLIEGKSLPLVIIICGLTTLEQDVFFGETDPKFQVTSDRMREALGEHVDAIVISPALFSAGWLVNPSFCRPPARKMRADRTEFLARQFGAIFAKDVVESFLSWSCPFIDWDQFGGKKDGRFPGPAKPSQQQQDAIVAFKVQIHNTLAGRLSAGHRNHSFNFEADYDDWQKLVGPRRHKPLSHFKQKWEKLGVGSVAKVNEEQLEFLGGAFGGNKKSQERHIKHLVYDSFAALPGYWALPFGRSARAAFRMFLENDHPDYRDCHEIFNIIEHRSTSAVVADMTLKYFGFSKPYGERCRDWDEPKWIKESTDSTHLAANRLFGEISKCIPRVDVPPGVNPNHLSVIQRRLEVPASYLSVAIHNHLGARVGSPQAIVKKISDFFEEIKDRQTELLVKDSALHDKCRVWLNSVHLPIRPQDPIIPPVISTTSPGESPHIAYRTPRASDSRGIAFKFPTTVSQTGKASETVSPPRPKANTTLAGLSNNLPGEMEELLPSIDPRIAIRTLTQEKEDLIKELMEAPPNKLVEIQEKMAENQHLLAFMEEIAQKKGLKSKNGAHESEKRIGAVSPPIHQGDSRVHSREGALQSSHIQQIQSPEQRTSPHLRGPLEKSDTKSHARRRFEEPAQEKPAGDVFQLSLGRGDTSSSPNETKPLSLTPHTTQKESKPMEKSETWVPPHLRGLQHKNI